MREEATGRGAHVATFRRKARERRDREHTEMGLGWGRRGREMAGSLSGRSGRTHR